MHKFPGVKYFQIFFTHQENNNSGFPKFISSNNKDVTVYHKDDVNKEFPRIRTHFNRVFDLGSKEVGENGINYKRVFNQTFISNKLDDYGLPIHSSFTAIYAPEDIHSSVKHYFEYLLSIAEEERSKNIVIDTY
jgi:hypothetical protein